MTSIELPPRFSDRPFLVSAARAASVGDARLRGPDLERPSRGVRVPPEASAHPLPIVNRCQAYAPLLRPGQLFSHTTAAMLWRVPLPSALKRGYSIVVGASPVSGAAPAPLHVTSTTGVRPRRAGIIGHRAEPGPLVVGRFGLPTSSAPDTWVSLAPLLTLDELIMAADSLVNVPPYVDNKDPRPFTTIAELRRAVEQSSTRGVRLAELALREVRVGSESPRETLLRLLLVRAGLPNPSLNVDVTTRDGKRSLGRGDLVWENFRTLCEYDGEQHRTDSTQYSRDERRIEDFMHAEWHVVRVRKSGMVGAGRDDTIERVKKALRMGGWRG